jgi:peptide/nickel transport system substrate-binding protein
MFRENRKLGAIAWVLIATMLLSPIASGCAPAAPVTPAPPVIQTVVVAATAAPTVAPTSVPARDELVYGVDETPDNLDPYGSTQATTMRLFSVVYDRLVDYDANMTLVPKLATSWEQKDSTTLRVHLRSGVKFHNGAPFTANDVKASLERVSDPANKMLLNFMWVPVKVTVVDDMTADIVASEPFSALLSILTFTAIVSAGDVDPTNPAKLTKQLNGTGYYKFVNYDTAQQKIFLQANQDYWGGPPKTPKLTFWIIPDSDARVSALQAGDVMVIPRVTAEQVMAIAGNPDLTILNMPSVDTAWLRLNCKNQYLSNPLVRQAIVYAIDRKAIATKILGNTASVLDSVLPKATQGYAPLTPVYDHNPDKAKALLAQAGYPNGFKLEMGTEEGVFPHHKDITQAVAQNLADVGIKTDVVTMDWGAYVAAAFGAKYDIAMFTWSDVTMDPDQFLSLWSAKDNLFAWDNSGYLPLFNAQRQLLGADRTAAVGKAAQYLWDQMPSVPLYSPRLIYAYSNKVQGFTHNMTYFELLHDVWVEK